MRKTFVVEEEPQSGGQGDLVWYRWTAGSVVEQASAARGGARRPAHEQPRRWLSSYARVGGGAVLARVVGAWRPPEVAMEQRREPDACHGAHAHQSSSTEQAALFTRSGGGGGVGGGLVGY